MRRAGYRRILANSMATAALLTGCSSQKPAARTPVVLVEPIKAPPGCLQVLSPDGQAREGTAETQKREILVSAGDEVYSIARLGMICPYSEQRTLRVAKIDASCVELELEVSTYKGVDGKCPGSTTKRKLRVSLDDPMAIDGDIKTLSKSGLASGVTIGKAEGDTVRIIFYTEPRYGPCVLD